MENKHIVELRGRLGLSQERFAQRLGVSLQTVRRWESGLSRPLPIISLKLQQLEREVAGVETKGGGPMKTERKEGQERWRAEAGLGGMFKGLGSFFDLVSKMVEEGQEETTRTGEIEGLGGKLKGVYGFTVRVGLGGEPVIERFGNIQDTEAGPVVTETREPVADVLDEGEELLVIVELPGVEEQAIQVAVRGDVLEVSASNQGRRYYKEVLLPATVDSASLTTSYRNGILEIRGRKA